jgi:hypothetical protein
LYSWSFSFQYFRLAHHINSSHHIIVTALFISLTLTLTLSQSRFNAPSTEHVPIWRTDSKEPIDYASLTNLQLDFVTRMGSAVTLKRRNIFVA